MTQSSVKLNRNETADKLNCSYWQKTAAQSLLHTRTRTRTHVQTLLNQLLVYTYRQAGSISSGSVFPDSYCLHKLLSVTIQLFSLSLEFTDEEKVEMKKFEKSSSSLSF